MRVEATAHDGTVGQVSGIQLTDRCRVLIRTDGDGRSIDCGDVGLGVWWTDCRHVVVECSDIGAVYAGILSPVKHGGVGAIC